MHCTISSQTVVLEADCQRWFGVSIEVLGGCGMVLVGNNGDEIVEVDTQNRNYSR